MLPNDFLDAIECESRRFRAINLRSAEDVSADTSQVLGMLPLPSADAGWCGGKLLGFADSGCVFSGEIVHFDPETGRIFAMRHSGEGIGQNALRAKRWRYEPFDFSAAIQSAVSACADSGQSVVESLAAVLGEVSVPDAVMPSPKSVDMIWTLPWSILWGPPGTGKTESTARQIATSITDAPGNRILVIAPTNQAVDNITERICDFVAEEGRIIKGSDCRIFRGGIGARGKLVEKYPDVLHDLEYAALVMEIDRLERRVHDLEASGAAPAQIAAMRQEASKRRRELPDETLFAAKNKRYSVVTLTVHRALRLASELKAGRLFSKVVIDEAGMVSRAAAAILAPLGDSVFLAGDPKQIGPIVEATMGWEASICKWLRKSPLSHIRDSDLPYVHRLRVQHRMHPAIRKVVGEFAYGGEGELEDGPGPLERAAAPSRLNAPRAAWLVLDEMAESAKAVAAARGKTGRGYEREFSARVAIEIATNAVACGYSVLALTPYRAQAMLVRRLASAAKLLGEKRLTASTIHRQQGAQADVVIVDTVAGLRPFPPDDVTMMLNVAASRAREHLLVLASQMEADQAVPGRLFELLERKVWRGAKGQDEFRDATTMIRGWEPPTRSGSLGDEVDGLKSRGPVYSEEQIALFERKIDDGHHLIRGVAGSGKTYVLANWAARLIDENRNAQVLVTFFNKALYPLIESLIRNALRRRGGRGLETDGSARITVRNVHSAVQCGAGAYDAVFVDEAQDMDSHMLSRLYALTKYKTNSRGERKKSFHLFMDDSQNIRGTNPIDQIAGALPDRLSFTGRSRVLKEAFRSTRQSLELAFNVVLDPHEKLRKTNPGMREFMKTLELTKEELLIEPDPATDNLWHVLYTEREGVVPTIVDFESLQDEEYWLRNQVARLIKDEGISPSDILVVSPVLPVTWARVLNRARIQAIAYGGTGGEDPVNFPIHPGSAIRVTTADSCKGHECPFVFFMGADKLDDATFFNHSSDRDLERQLRARFYVSTTRAMVRQYVAGLATSRFVSAACYYRRLLMSGGRELS